MNRSTPTLFVIVASLAISTSAALAEDTSVNCDTATQDIAKLEAEKKGSVEQMAKGVTSIVPSTAALHMLTGTHDESKEIASGEYNARIDAHIAKIKSTCGID